MNLKLNWRIFIFYVVLGLIPFIILSWISLSEYANLVGSVTEQKVVSLLNEAKTKTEFRVQNIDRELTRLSDRGEVQRAFSQFLTAPRIQSLKELVTTAKDNSKLFSRISLYSKGGIILADTDNQKGIVRNIPPSFKNSKTDILHIQKGSYELFIHKIYDFQNDDKLVGFAAGYVSTDKLAQYFNTLILPQNTSKKIYNNIGEVIYKNEPISLEGIKTVVYNVSIKPLQWTFTIHIPEKVLFKDVNHMRFNTFLYVFFGVISVAIAGYYISRRLTVPINKIMNGTKELASGNLDYRLNMVGGCEIKKLSDAIDQMAEELRLRQNELAQANKLASLGTMSAGIAHEIKNPLAGLKTSAQTIKMMSENETLKNISGNLESEVDRLSQIVNDLLDFSKPQQSNKSRFPLLEVVDKCLSLVNNELKKKHIEVIYENCAIEVYADKDQLVQVFINLLLNAVAAIEHKSGIIEIIASNKKGFTTVEISDNGSGIAESDMDKIFDPFYSLSKQGTGLGLSVVYSLLRRNGISINVESKVYQGTKIILTFSGDLND